MTVPMYSPPNPAPVSRPTTVTASVMLLYAIAVAQGLLGVAFLATLGSVREAFRNSYGGSEFDNEMGAFVTGVMVVIALIYLFIAIGLVVLAIFNGRGKNPARIVTWVFAGIGLCCNTLAVFDSVPAAVTSGAGSGGPSEQQFEADLAVSMPAWYEPVVALLALVTLVALLAVVIMLALPSSNAYFRKPVMWNPPGPYPGYPGQQGYPGQPGYPQQPGYPPAYGQPYPGPPAASQPGSYPGSPGAYPGPPMVPPSPPNAGPDAYPGAPGHLGSPEQYGQPGQPAPGLPPYPGRSGGPERTEPGPASDPWAAPPAPDQPSSGGDQQQRPPADPA